MFVPASRKSLHAPPRPGVLTEMLTLTHQKSACADPGLLEAKPRAIPLCSAIFTQQHRVKNAPLRRLDVHSVVVATAQHIGIEFIQIAEPWLAIELLLPQELTGVGDVDRDGVCRSGVETQTCQQGTEQLFHFYFIEN